MVISLSQLLWIWIDFVCEEEVNQSKLKFNHTLFPMRGFDIETKNKEINHNNNELDIRYKYANYMTMEYGYICELNG